MIKFINLKNFKCFVDEPFKIAPLTLFTGINGMGKSSVIQSLLLLKQSYENTYLQSKAKVSLNNFSYVDLETAGDLCYAKAHPKNVTITMENDDGKKHEWEINASKVKESDLDVKYSGDGDYDKEALFSKDFIYLSAERFGPRRDYSRKSKRVFNTKIGIQGELTPAYIYDATKNDATIVVPALKHPSAANLSLFENLNAWIAEILGRGISTNVSELDDETLKLTFKLKGLQGGDFSALQVGFGFSFSLPVILAPLIAKPGDLLIIENPEAHLHPSAQSKIGKLLGLAAQNGVQVIIETHSDHVLNAIRVMVKGDKFFGRIDPNIVGVHFFYNEKTEESEIQGHRSIDILSSGKMSGWPAGFFDEWESSLKTLISK